MKATPRSLAAYHTPRGPSKGTNNTTAPLLARVRAWFASPLDRAPRTNEPLELYRARTLNAAKVWGSP